MEIGLTLLTITPSNSLTEFVLPIPLALGSAVLKILILTEDTSTKENSTVLLTLKLQLLLGHFYLLIPVDKQANTQVYFQLPWKARIRATQWGQEEYI